MPQHEGRGDDRRDLGFAAARREIGDQLAASPLYYVQQALSDKIEVPLPQLLSGRLREQLARLCEKQALALAALTTATKITRLD